ncbi:zona pellucida-like domain-containing protein 1 [Stigmatopora nigra]
MALIVVLILTSFWIAGREALSLSECGAYARRPKYTDITVMCGTSAIELAIQVCPVIYTGYNASLLFLNHIEDNSDCHGTLDELATPPVVRFSFPIQEGTACGSTFLTSSAMGTGLFSEFSNIQRVNVSGVVRSLDPTIGTITYNVELKYFYSCAYPLEYIINNTQVAVSSASIALKDNNGSFISTLSMTLFQDENYTSPLIMPNEGIELRKKIYVEVVASNLTSQYFVLLDRCYASVSPHPTNSTFFSLFVSCSIAPMTTILENGEGQKARFFFSAFRFIEQQNETVSTYYLHCITRLCEQSTCSTFKQCNNRRRRNLRTTVFRDRINELSVLTVPIKTRTDEPTTQSKEETQPANDRSDGQVASVGLGIAVAVLVVLAVTAILMAASLHRKLKLLS